MELYKLNAASLLDALLCYVINTEHKLDIALICERRKNGGTRFSWKKGKLYRVKQTINVTRVNYTLTI